MEVSGRAAFIFEMVYYYLVMGGAAYVVYCAVRRVLVTGKMRWRKLLLFGGCYILCTTIIFIGDIVNLPPALLVFICCVCVCAEGSGWKRVTLGLMVASTVLAYNAFLDSCFFYVFPRLWESCRGLMRLAFAFILYIGIRQNRMEQDFELSTLLWKLMLMLTCMPLGVVVSLVCFRSPYSINMGTMIADGTLLFLAFISFIGLFRALSVLKRQQDLEQENLLAEHNRRYYEEMEMQQFEIRRLKHDLANHLQALLALTEERRTSYIEELIEHSSFTQVLNYSADATVNAVLTSKESLIRHKQIGLHAVVDIQEELPFEKADICAVLSNAIDNAVEACECLLEAEGERKAVRTECEISLTARFAKGVLAVCVKNPCRAFIGKKKFFYTTKKDAANHGYGLRSIREAVKKYGGSMEVEQKDGWFTLFLYIPASQ